MSDDLVERLLDGVRSCGMHDDNETELFDIDDANEVMVEAADRVKQLEEALRQARDFIADEYRDPSREPVGDWIAKEARPVFDHICAALGDANAPR